jgi:tRNA-specific 2-thiouridylase
VDSSVSAALLKDQGYNVVGVFIRTWTPDFIECTWRDERRDAMRVCAHLNIPFLECNAEEEYKKGVADYMIEEYKKGNTPNPDVMCNREVKFGVFWNFAKAHGADYIATGHYASTERRNSFLKVLGRGGREPVPDHSKKDFSFRLLKGVDDSKDQSYFLWTLTQEDLRHVLFPVGHLMKTEVRKLAQKYKIPVAEKKDSQGVCFLGPLDMKDFLKHYIKSKKGNVLDEKGNIIGVHNGAVFFTLGERHGFTLLKHSENDKPLYVVSKDVSKNTVTVSPREIPRDFPREGLIILNVNWILNVPEKDKIYQAQIRYHGELLNCRIIFTGQTCENGAKIIFEKEVIVDKGQSIVVYDKDICLGGGVVI